MIKKVFFIVSILVLTVQSKVVYAHTGVESVNTKNADKSSAKYPAKTGYNLAPFPEFRIDPVVGVYIGINATLFDYGNGEKYPDYVQLFNLNAAWGTKGKTNVSLRYKKYGKYNLSAKIGRSEANLYPFYGLNGYQTYYSLNYHTPGNSEYITSAFYNYKQQKTHSDFYVQKDIVDTKFFWLLGADISHYDLGRVDFERLNRNAEELEVIEDEVTLYDNYIDWELIKQEEKNGGWANSIRFAMLYDSRDRLTNPVKGIWTQATLRYSPEVFGNYTSALQLSVKHHQFISLLPERISFAYRLRYDATFGELPFYQKQILADGIEGYGGATGAVGEGFGTIWGIHQNRVVGKQMALGNFEVRAKLFRFRFLKQNISTAIVPLFHTGLILEPYELDLSKVDAVDKEKFFRSTHKGWYSAVGLGGKVIMNENIVVGLDWSYALNKEAGSHALFVGLGYTF